MNLFDLQPDVIKAAKQEISASQLTVAVAGTSGKGNASLTSVLFPVMAQNGFLTMRKKGNARFYTATQKGLAKFPA